jgi:hypothetical protein
LAVDESKKKVLATLNEFGAPVTLTELMEKSGLTRGHALGELSWLTRAGFAGRTPEKPGKFFITDEGKEALAMPTISKNEAVNILKTLPAEKCFYFHTDVGRYTDMMAPNLSEFCEIIKKVDATSIEFHTFRGDFENWIRDALGDSVLAGRIAKIKDSGARGEELRERLYETAKTRYDQLRHLSEL